MSSMPQFPSCIALQSRSNGKFLRYVHEHGEKKYRRLQLDGEDALNPFTRFDVEPWRLHPGLVHIRCRYNRKYWAAARRQQGGDGDDDNGRWVTVADADEPEEDLSKTCCTLIKAVPAAAEADSVVTDDDVHPHREPVMIFRFVVAGRLQGAGDDVHDDGGARMSLSGTGGVGSCLCVGRRGGERQVVGDGDDDDADAGFIIFNLSNSERLLPRFVAFKGSNGRYLTPRTIQSNRHLVYESDDIGPMDVTHEIEYDRNDRHGSFRVRHRNTVFWRLPNNTDFILADGRSNNSSSTLTSLFQVIQVGNLFALRPNIGGGLFCMNQTAPSNSNFRNCLEFASWGLRREALVQVEEAAMHRDIDDIVYDLDNVRVSEPKVLSVATTGAVNDTSTPNTKRLTISFEETETAQWDSTLELTIGYRATMRVGFAKLGLGAKAELSAEFFGSYNWGETVVTTVKKEVEYEVTVPPKTKVSVRVIASKATCDVPFSYRQRVTFSDGRVQTRTRRDGIFTGVNSYNYQFQVTESPIDQRLTLAASS